MQKKQPPKPKPSIQKSSGGISKSTPPRTTPSPQKSGGGLSKAPPPRRTPPPVIQKAMGQKATGSISKPPPAQMVTALERKDLREQRRQPVQFATPTSAGMAASTSLTDQLQVEAQQLSYLQNHIMLTSLNDELEDIGAAITSLPANVENLRGRGYVFKSYLEKKVETLVTQWRDVRPKVEEAARTQSQALQTDAANIQNLLNRRQSASMALTSLEGKVNAANSNLRGMYDALYDNILQTQQQVDDVSWTLQQAEMASFGFLPTEGPLEAAPANWKKPDDKHGVEGVLILTDQRLLFEQKEEVATKKVLFITTEKQKVQGLQWQIPVMHIDKAAGSKRGFMSKDDFLTVTCSGDGAFLNTEGQPMYVPGVGGKMTSLDIHLKGETGEAWQGHIGRVKSREIEKERTVPVDQAAAEAVANAPTKCTTCGATLTQTILRGQTEIKCEYCGSVIRIG